MIEVWRQGIAAQPHSRTESKGAQDRLLSLVTAMVLWRSARAGKTAIEL